MNETTKLVILITLIAISIGGLIGIAVRWKYLKQDIKRSKRK